jgi:vacuolar-type H+-ATPase subunit E/Vma4
MKSFEKDKKELLVKIKEIVESYMDSIEADLRYIPAQRKMRELKNVIKEIDKWKKELK